MSSASFSMQSQRNVTAPIPPPKANVVFVYTALFGFDEQTSWPAPSTIARQLA